GHGAGIAAIGVAAAIGFDEYWSKHGSYGGSVSLGGDLAFGALPFLLLGVLASVYASTYLPWVAVAGLLVLTYFEYKSNATTDSSTAVSHWSWSTDHSASLGVSGGLGTAPSASSVAVEHRWSCERQ